MLVPERYELFLTVDPRADGFEGRVRISGRGGPAVLDADGLEILDASGEYTYDGKTLTVQGEGEVEVMFRGRYREDLLGMYVTERGGYRAVVTQFEEAYARRVFPCVDKPKYRAVFSVTLRVPGDSTAIFNTEPVEEREEGEWKIIRFRETPPMPTYLLFFGVGDLEGVSRGRIRGYAFPGNRERMGLALDVAEKSVEFFEEKLGVEYPLKKLDLIAVPDFVFGAMENWGAMLFRESAMLHDPSLPPSYVHRVAEVVAHEVAHQWFGDLVTPASWKYIWLNESFATLLAYLAVDARFPSWGIMERFYATEFARALTRDSLPSTVPVELPWDREEVITANTSAIIYSKGATLLFVLRQILGDDFWRALGEYLRAHAYGYASTEDFWSVMGKYWPHTDKFVSSWIRRPGHPVLIQEGDRVEQSRFTFFGEREETRFIPVLTVDGVMYMERKRERIGAFILPGFYRVFYEDPDDAVDRLGENNYWKILEDYFAFLIEKRIGLKEYLRLLEKTWAPRLALLSSALHSLSLLERRGRIDKEYILSLLEDLEPGKDLHGRIVRSLVLKAMTVRGKRLDLGESPEEKPALYVQMAMDGELEELRSLYRNATHEAEEVEVLRGMAYGDPQEALNFFLSEVPKRARIYPMLEIAGNRKFAPGDFLRENAELLKKELLKSHLRSVLVSWIPRSDLSEAEIREIFRRIGDREVESYTIELTRAYRRL